MPTRDLYRRDPQGQPTTPDPAAVSIAATAGEPFALWGGLRCRVLAGVLEVAGPGTTWKAVGAGPEHAPHRDAMAELALSYEGAEPGAIDGEYDLVGPGLGDADYGLERAQLWRRGVVRVGGLPLDERLPRYLAEARIHGAEWVVGEERVVVLRADFHSTPARVEPATPAAAPAIGNGER